MCRGVPFHSRPAESHISFGKAYITLSNEFHERAHIRVEDGVETNVALLELEGLDQNVYVIVPDLRDDRLVGVDPHASHARLLPHVGFAVEPAGLGWSP